METTVNIQDLTPDQIKELHAQLIEKEKKEIEQRMADRTALVELENDAVLEMLDEAESLSLAIVNFKQKWIRKLEPLMKMKTELGKAADKQRSFTFKTKDGSGKSVIDYNETFKYDDGIHAGVEFAKQWLLETAEENEKSKMMSSMIENLLGKSRGGTYSAENLWTFVNAAEEYNVPLLNAAADAVKKSLYKEATSVSVKVFKKDEFGYKQLPLSATKA
jgi:hypothetical protein